MVARLPLLRRLKAVVVLFAVVFLDVPPPLPTAAMEWRPTLIIFSPAPSEIVLAVSLTGLVFVTEIVVVGIVLRPGAVRC